MPDDLHWVKIASAPDQISFGDNELAEVYAGEKKICIGRWKGELFAFAATCPHAGGPFAGGFIDVLGNVVCPLHRYKFCVKNGRNVSGEGYALKRWPVLVDEGGVFVGFSPSVFAPLG